jgi:hypothetical protein
MASSWNGKVPFDKDGNLRSYEIWDSELRDNFEFDEVLEVVGFYRGRSAAGLELSDVGRRRFYPCFLKESMAVIQAATKGVVNGRWTFCKRGSNFGIKLLEAK